MKKSPTKTTETVKEKVNLTNELNQTETSGTITKTPKTITTEQINDLIKGLQVPASHVRIVVDEVNDNVKKLIDELWNTDYQFIVSGTNESLLGKINFEMINRSRSMGRWRVVTPSQCILEPCELFLYTKEYTDAIFNSIPAKKKINFFKSSKQS